MRVLIVNTSEQTGGAAVAANRLMKALINHGVKAKMLVRDKQSADIHVCRLPQPRRLLWLKFVVDRLKVLLSNRLSRQNLWKIDTGGCGTDITRLPEFREADVIHLHWVNQGMLSLSDIQRILASGKKVVWTLHDLWPICGVCHHPMRCDRFKSECRYCPLLVSPSERDVSNRIFRKKQRLYKNARLHLVAVSRWVERMAEASALTCHLPVTVINNTLDITKFTVGDKKTARKRLGIAGAKHVIAFGAARIDDPIKDFGILIEALKVLKANDETAAGELTLLLFGNCKDATILDDIPVKYKYLEYVDDTVTVYQAADCIVSSSHYETFGQTMAEAQACGAVPVTFAGGGQEDIIDHLQNGYLASERTAEALAEGILWALRCNIQPEALHSHAAQRFSPEAIAARHIKLYESI